ncbi:MAG: hypothetical protein AB7O26_11505 [Planctomycetaceae bacterium]
MAKRLIVIVGLIVVSLSAAWGVDEKREVKPAQPMTLLGTLAEWQYPGSQFGGAEITDGGNRTISSAKCQALLTTSDAFEKVTKFYEEKFVSGPREPGTADKEIVPQSVSTQDNSSKRPLQLKVIVVNRATTSTTLVISRAEGEAKTHIAWSHYMRLGVPQ